MRVKTFRGNSTTAVFAEIKAEFGDNAIILSNKSVEEDGRKIHEIMVGVDGQEETCTGLRKQGKKSLIMQ
ncbi:hypothetical protein [Maridesulfovibrio sp.]|uniref:hypothetical protein n=1 Tax=Maridesulfovibrio sp. TaxID=2795000 RepID=UPI0039F05EE6